MGGLECSELRKVFGVQSGAYSKAPECNGERSALQKNLECTKTGRNTGESFKILFLEKPSIRKPPQFLKFLSLAEIAEIIKREKGYTPLTLLQSSTCITKWNIKAHG